MPLLSIKEKSSVKASHAKT